MLQLTARRAMESPVVRSRLAASSLDRYPLGAGARRSLVDFSQNFSGKKDQSGPDCGLDHPHSVDPRIWRQSSRCPDCKGPLTPDDHGHVKATCRDCRKQDAGRRWNDANSWLQLLVLNWRYLRGKVDLHPDWNAPIESETSSLIPRFMKMHEFGLMTLCSQPNETEKMYKQRWSNSTMTYVPTKIGSDTEIKDRAYVDFVVPTIDDFITLDMVRTLCNILERRHDIMIVIRSLYDSYEPVDIECAEELPGSLPPLNAGEDSDAIYKYRQNLDEMWPEYHVCGSDGFNATQLWRHNLDAGPTYLRGIEDQGQGFPAAVRARPLLIHVGAREWGKKTDVAQIIIDACGQAGMIRAYTQAVAES